MFSLVPRFWVLTVLTVLQQLCMVANTKRSLRPAIMITDTAINGASENWLCSSVKHNGYKCGDDMCRCVNNQACCFNKYHELNYIPKLPNNITWLNFTGNYLPHITESTFLNLTHLKLQHFALKSNNIKSCGPNTFRNLKYLVNFHLQNENITVSNLKKCIRSITSSCLKSFSLECLNLNTTTLPPDFFTGLEFNPVENLNMDGTYMKNYNQSTFSALQHVRELHLAGCKVTQCILTQSYKLINLILSNNVLTRFPKFCVDGKAVFPNLTLLMIDTNFIIFIIPTDLACMKSLTKLDLSMNPLKTVDSNLISSLPRLFRLNIEYIVHKYTEPCVASFAFNSSSLVKLYFGNNRLSFDGIKVKLKAFHHCRLLDTLYIENSDMSSTTEEMFEELLSGLRNLKKLSLAVTRITYLPRVIPKYMEKIESLYLDSNFITGWPQGYFYNLSALSMLNLGNNHITIIDSSSFSQKNLERLKWINISKNTYSCTCQLLWFINFLKVKKHFKNFKYFPQEYICASPLQFKNKQIMSTGISEQLCIITGQISIIIISSITSALFLILLISAIYRYRWHLRYYVYMVQFRQIRYQRLLHPDNYQYNVYLSCSDEDCDFVLDQIVPKLEDDLGLELYLPHRDGRGNKIDEIISNLDNSQKVVLVLSNSYTKDHYCEFEASLAYDRRLSDRRDLMIVILLQEIDAGNMSNILHKILDVDKYIKWGWDEESVQLFWLKLITFLNNTDDIRP